VIASDTFAPGAASAGGVIGAAGFAAGGGTLGAVAASLRAMLSLGERSPQPAASRAAHTIDASSTGFACMMSSS